MEIRAATLHDTQAIAELALLAGEGIPAYFWAQSQRPDESLIETGARSVSSETGNFSYRNVVLAVCDHDIAGMMLAYRLPSAAQAEDVNEFPEFIRPLIDLEQCVPGSYYINMLATYPRFRHQGIGTALMGCVDSLAQKAGCTSSSVEVFDENAGAVRLYRRLGYQVIESRPVIAHPSHPYHGNILLLSREVQ